MKDLFNSFEDFKEEQANVFNFHNKITDTIVNLLQKTGTIIIPEEDQDYYCFTYLDMEGESYTTKAVMIDPCDDEKYCLIVTSDDSGDKCFIDVDDINSDMIIEEKILRLVFDKYNEVEE